ncbi:cytochrome p450 monooxygenase, partial [Stemphylium lycopersici]
LHFAHPQAYHDIYNNKNRWDKEANLYKSFGEDESSFGFLTYAEAKERKHVLNPSFSQAAVRSAEGLCTDKVKALCAALERNSRLSKSCDMFYAFRCMSVDVITTLCFGSPVNAVDAPDFEAPIVVALDASMPASLYFKYSDLFKNFIMKCPPNISRVLSPATAGLIDLNQLLTQQIDDLTNDPEKLKLLPHNMTVFHRLLDPDAHRDKTVPSARSLYEESQALMFGGADTTGNTLMVGTFHLLKDSETLEKLKTELLEAWPTLHGQEPKLQHLENMSYLNAVIKESLRLSSGVTAGLLRIVPANGATISGAAVPPGTIVSCSSTFVHYNPDIFPEPEAFRPERWIESPELDNWLVAFSRGPRACLGTKPEKLVWRDVFLPYYYEEHLKVNLHPLDD